MWRETLSKLEFVVCIDRQLTADASYADIVLPATTMFEIDSYMVYGPIFRLREKLIEPVGEARNDYLIMAELADRLGYGHLYPRTEEEMIRFALEGSGYTLEQVKAAGGWVKSRRADDGVPEVGEGRLARRRQARVRTPTGKFEICSTILEDYGYEPLPKYTEPNEGPHRQPRSGRRFPWCSTRGPGHTPTFVPSTTASKGLVKDNPEPSGRAQFEGRRRTGNLRRATWWRCGRREVRFRFGPESPTTSSQGAVECNMGGGTPVGPKAWQEWNVNELTDIGNYDEISGFPVYKALLCDVVKIEEGDESTRKSAGVEARSCVAGGGGMLPRRKRRRIYLDHNATTPVIPR